MIMPLMMVMIWDEVEDKDEDNLVTIVMVIGYDDCPHTHTVVDIHREQRLGMGGELSLLFAHLLTFFIIHSSPRYVTFAFHLYLWLVEIGNSVQQTCTYFNISTSALFALGKLAQKHFLNKQKIKED